MFFMTLFKCGLPKFSDRRQMPVITLFARDGLVWFIAVLRKQYLLQSIL